MRTWSKKVPKEEGWYWFSYVRRDERVVCPAMLVYLCEDPPRPLSRNLAYVRTAYNDSFVDKPIGSQKGFDGVVFGPEIIPPKAPR